MIIAIVFAHLWGVIQLIVTGSLARTIRVRTVLAAIAVGLYACAPLAVLLQVAWTRPAAWLTGAAIYNMVVTASYTVDPFIEEIVKVLPLAVLLMIPVIRRQWSVTDCVLIGAAAGAGFGLAEDLYHYGASPDKAHAIDSGWVLATNIHLPEVPSVRNTLTSWLPPGTSMDNVVRLNVHLVWSAIGGLAVGLMVLSRMTAARVVAVGLLLYVGLDHAAGNATTNGPGIPNTWLALLSTPLRVLGDWRGFMPIAALAVAWWFDRRRQRTGEGVELTLLAEQSASPRLVGTLRAAVSHLPSSLPSVFGFVRMRRVYNSSRASGLGEGTDGLRAMVVDARDRTDRELGQVETPWLLPGWCTPTALLGALRRPVVIVWLVLMHPSVMWFVVGGWPQTAGLQAKMTAPVAWIVVLVFSVVAQAWLAWQVIVGMRSWSKALRLPIGDDAAMLGLRIACGVGAVGLGGYALMRAFSGLSPRINLLDNVDAQEALASGTSATSLQLANAGAAGMPPQSSGASPDAVPETGHERHKMLVEHWMEWWFGTPESPTWLTRHSDSQLRTVGQALAIFATLPVWGYGAVLAAVLDHASHIVDVWGFWRK